MNAPSAQQQVEFLNQLQRLLAEGSFVATYKFALLHALADLAVEHGRDTDGELEVSTLQIAEKFIQYYWRQIRPFAPQTGVPTLLKQNTDKHPAIVRELLSLSARGIHSINVLQEDRRHWSSLVRTIRKTICAMPLGKLQTVGNRSQAFLYDDTAARTGRIVESITLKPGVMFCLRHFHPLITDLVRGAWVRYVRRYNAAVLGAPSDLDEFLFGSERAPLSAFAPLLRDLQDGCCFYCGREMSHQQPHVDHFIPWARYPVDLAHNFVLAHAGCNSAKADHLAAARHLEKWIERNRQDLSGAFDEIGVVHDNHASLRITEWAYRMSASSPTWIERSTFENLPLDWESLFAA